MDYHSGRDSQTGMMFSLGMFRPRPVKVQGHLVAWIIIFTCGCIGELGLVRGEYWAFRSGFDTYECTEGH